MHKVTYKYADYVICVYMCSVVSNSAISWTVACQAFLSMGFSRQEYWSRLPFPTPRDLPNPGIESMCLVSVARAGRSFSTEPPGCPTVGLHLEKPIVN